MNTFRESSSFSGNASATLHSVLPGHFLATRDRQSALTTLLGSCVSACIRDVETGVGGLNHFLLPSVEGAEFGFTARYGTNAMELLINRIVGLGGRKDRLEAKVFGGGIINTTTSSETIGVKNAAFVLDYLETEEIPVRASDLGGIHARRIIFYPATGLVRVNRLGNEARQRAHVEENRLKIRLSKQIPASAVELFE
jgi:chemotaxis protein CheD